jgi:hypothetical protein
MIEIVLKFEIEDGDGAAMMKVMALSEEDGSFLMSVTGKSARTANTITPAARELVVETDLVTVGSAERQAREGQAGQECSVSSR